MRWLQTLFWFDLVMASAGAWAVWYLRAPPPLYFIPSQVGLNAIVLRGLTAIGKRRGWH